MQIPLQVTFRNMDPSAAVDERIREQAEKLEQFHGRVSGCRVVVEAQHRRHRKGILYHVRIDLTVPGAEVVVSRDPELDHAHEDVYVAIRDAFDAARRQLEDVARVKRGALKTHEEQQHGRVLRMVPREDHGFIETSDGREIYFHRHSVLDDGFDRLEPGSPVWFVDEMGDEGPQATTVRIVGKHHPAAP